MRTISVSLAAILAFSTVCPLGAQTSAPASQAGKPEPILGMLPAGSVGYLVVGNVKTCTDNVDRYLKQIGVTELIWTAEVKGLLDLIQKEAKIGPVNPEGGFAVVMLDPAPLGVDLEKAFQGEKEGGTTRLHPPIVVYIPAASVDALFPNHEKKPAGKYTEVTLSKAPGYACQSGGYVLLSPEARFLDAALAATGKASAELSKPEAEALGRADVFVHVNFKLLSPILDKMLGKFQETAAGREGPEAVLGTVLPIYRQMLQEIETLSLSYSVVETGVVIEGLAAVRADGAFGKILAACKPQQDTALVDRLPNLPYVLAIGTSYEGAGESITAFRNQVLDVMLAATPKEKQTPEFLDRIRGIRQFEADVQKQVDSVQVVLGGAPEGSGVFAIAGVARCKDSAALKASYQKLAEIMTAAPATGPAETPAQPILPDFTDPFASMKLTYEKNAETVGELSVDAINISHPMLDMLFAPGSPLVGLTGESKARLRLVAPDANTLLFTFGGSTAFLQEAVRASKGGGTIFTGAERDEAAKYLPRNSNCLLLLNVGNLFTLVEKAVKTIAPQEGGGGPVLPFQITCKTPIAISSGFTGNVVQVDAYIPTELVKQCVDIYKSLKMMSGGGSRSGPPAAGPPPGAEGF